MTKMPYTKLPVDDQILREKRKVVRDTMRVRYPDGEFTLRTFYLGPRSSPMWSLKSTAHAAKIAIYERKKNQHRDRIDRVLIGYYFGPAE